MARYKVLKSVARRFGHSFTSLMNYRGDDYVMGHILRRAREVGDDTLLVDILRGEATPRSLLAKDVAASVSSYCDWFPNLVAAHRTEMKYIRSARMSIRFDLSTRRPLRHSPSFIESPYTCRVDIEDDRGKLWSAEIRDRWYPEAGTVGVGAGRTVVERLGQLIRSIWSRPSVLVRLQPNER
jgi:hypothetical protein